MGDVCHVPFFYNITITGVCLHCFIKAQLTPYIISASTAVCLVDVSGIKLFYTARDRSMNTVGLGLCSDE